MREIVLPVATRPSHADGGACVGWYLLSHSHLLPKEIVANHRFPRSEMIAAAIQKLNPLLTLDEALVFAERIVDLNDQGRFSDAWLVARNAIPDEFENLITNHQPEVQCLTKCS